jgi:hypothetical protein
MLRPMAQHPSMNDQVTGKLSADALERALAAVHEDEPTRVRIVTSQVPRTPPADVPALDVPARPSSDVDSQTAPRLELRSGLFSRKRGVADPSPPAPRGSGPDLGNGEKRRFGAPLPQSRDSGMQILAFFATALVAALLGWVTVRTFLPGNDGGPTPSSIDARR